MTRQADTWVGACCEYCGAEWTAESRGRPLRYDASEDSIVCGRGYGCARRRPDHERVSRGGAQYLLDGHWYTVEELAALAAMSVERMRLRLKAGWHVVHALEIHPAQGRPPHHEGRLRAALARAGGHPRKSPPAARDAPRGRPAPIRGISAAARELGIDEGTLGARVRRLGSLEAAIALGPPKQTRPRTSGLVAAARELGVSRQTLGARVRRLGSLEAAIESLRARRAA